MMPSVYTILRMVCALVKICFDKDKHNALKWSAGGCFLLKVSV